MFNHVWFSGPNRYLIPICLSKEHMGIRTFMPYWLTANETIWGPDVESNKWPAAPLSLPSHTGGPWELPVAITFVSRKQDWKVKFSEVWAKGHWIFLIQYWIGMEHSLQVMCVWGEEDFEAGTRYSHGWTPRKRVETPREGKDKEYHC